MRITSLVENTSHIGLPVEHGLSLFIELIDGRKILFDMGQSALYADNANRLGLSVSDVDMAIISHGHYDHGGGLSHFLVTNHKAPVYIQRDAFRPHYSLRDTGMHFIGIDPELAADSRVVLCDDQTVVSDQIILFSDVEGQCCYPVGNRLLYMSPDGISNGKKPYLHDNFCHEQNLIVEENHKTVLFAGCAHCGIVNILRRSIEILGHAPTHVFAGMHLIKSGLSGLDEDSFIRDLSGYLQLYQRCKYYTMHCTGTTQYEMLRNLMGDQIEYLACGDSVMI